MFSRIKLLLLLLFAAPLYAAPTVTVTATSASILGTNQPISLTCVLTDPNQTGILRSGTNVITVLSTSTTTPGNTATCGPLYGNDVITDGFGNALTTYYLIAVYTVHGGIVDSTPSLLQAYQFAGSGTFDLSATLPFSLGPVSPAGSVLGQNLAFTGNNTHSGTETFTGPLNSNNLATGNVANKPASADAVRYVSATGNDANDGLSMGTAKATLPSAYSSLANCTNTGFSQNGTPGTYTRPCGTIYVAESTSAYTLSSQLSISGPFVRIVGLGEHSTVINCTVNTSCILWTVGPTDAGVGATFSSDYGLYNLTLAGNNGSAQSGLNCTDCPGLTLDHVRFANFAGTSGKGVRLVNVNYINERNQFHNVWWDNDTCGLSFEGTGGINQNSYGHEFFSDLQFTLNNAQTAFCLSGNAAIYSSFIEGVINTNGPGTNTYTSVSISGTAALRGMFMMVVDNAGGGTISTSGTTSSNFQVWPWGGGGSGNPPQFITQDDAPIFNNTTSSPFNSPTWALNNVNQWTWYLDGTNQFCTADMVAVKAMACFPLNANGGGMTLAGATSGVSTIKSAATAGGTQTIPNGTGNFVLDSLTQTLTNKSTSAGPLTGTVASGTSTLTSNATLAAVTSQAAITTTATGALATDAIEWSYASAPTAGDSLCHVSPYVTAGNVNFVRTNPTAAAQNVSALVINWRIVR